MPNYPEQPTQVSVPPTDHWMWSEDAQTVVFISSRSADEAVLKKMREINVDISDLQRRAEWLADVCPLNHRGRPSIRHSLSPARLNAYRSSVMRRQGDFVTIDDVKAVAVSLLQDNYSLPIPICFLAVIKSKELDDILTKLLLYLSCFFEHKSLENNHNTAMVVDIITEQHMIAETLAKKEIAQKKLAISYFSLIMDLEVEGPTHSVLQCLYSFFCYVAWVTFGRKDLRDIQEEVGRLLYSDTFNSAVRSRSDGDSGRTCTAVNGSVKSEEADPKEIGCSGTFRHRLTQRRPKLSSLVNQRSPLMMCLLPSPKERSPHLFVSSRARTLSPPRAQHCDTQALMEELDQQLDSVSFGILGKPMRLFCRSTLMPHGEETNNREVEDDNEVGSDLNNNSKDDPGKRVRGSGLSFMGPKQTGLASRGSISRIISKNSVKNTVEAVTSATE